MDILDGARRKEGLSQDIAVCGQSIALVKPDEVSLWCVCNCVFGSYQPAKITASMLVLYGAVQQRLLVLEVESEPDLKALSASVQQWKICLCT